MLKILIAEDNQDIKDAVVFLLRELGYTVKAVDNGKQAIEVFDSFKPDVVLTDYCMPDLNGLSMVKILKAKNPNIAVVFMSACNDINVAVSAMKLGAFDFLPKPFDLSKLEDIIKNAYESKLEVNSEDSEKERIVKAIRQTHTLEDAARILNICTETLWRKRKKYGIEIKKVA